MAKRKRTKKKKSSNKILSYIVWILALIALGLTTLLVGYYLGYNSATESKIKKDLKKKEQHAKIPVPVQTKTEVKVKKESVEKRLERVLKKESKNYNSAAHEIENESLVHPPKIKLPQKPLKLAKKPRLAIIIDDVQTASQVRAIKSLNMLLTMSFLPPRPGRPNSAKIAAKEKFYMVHVPMEAMHFNKEEPTTLHVNDSQDVILKRIHTIKQLFPKVTYINNHTGSKFTSDEKAMQKLIYALQKNHIAFIDSRTTAKTKAPMVEKSYGLKYIARDVFLDHHMDKPYILKQIKEAVRIAKAHGEAIAIGHPHKNTLEALYESKKMLAKEVDLVLINKIQ